MTRDKATIRIKVTDEQGQPVVAHLGVSVYDHAYDNPADPTNMLTYCYLSSRIRGKIHDPAYYLDDKNSRRAEAMELLLLTQGWRRYVWNMDDSNNAGKPFLTDIIQGVQTIDSKSRQDQGLGLIQVSGPDGNVMFIQTDSIGQFTVELDMMHELRGGYVYLKPMTPQQHKPELLLTDLFPQINQVRKTKSDYYPFKELSSYNDNVIIHQVISQDSAILLNEVVVTGKGGRIFRDKFMGRLDSLAQMDLGPFVCEHGWLENYLPGYTHHHDQRYVPNPSSPGKRSTPVIGKSYPVLKANYYDDYNGSGNLFTVADRKYVTYEGVIFSEEELLRMNNLWRTKGYYAKREFYQPDEIDILSSLPDARNTLFWDPYVITDEKGEAAVTFYCSDINSGFIGLIEGIDGLGLLGTTECNFRVLRNIGN